MMAIEWIGTCQIAQRKCSEQLLILELRNHNLIDKLSYYNELPFVNAN